MGIKRHASGDISVQTATEESTHVLLADEKWVIGLAKSGEIIHDSFSVFVHNIWRSNIDEDTKKAIQYLHKENRTLHPELRIVTGGMDEENDGGGQEGVIPDRSNSYTGDGQQNHRDRTMRVWRDQNS